MVRTLELVLTQSEVGGDCGTQSVSLSPAGEKVAATKTRTVRRT